MYCWTSAYALKHDSSLGYADTTHGEGLYGYYMEAYGFPALRKMGVPTLAMTYFTHQDGLKIVLKTPGPFIAALLNVTLTNKLAGVDLDYEPQAMAKAIEALRAEGHAFEERVDPAIRFFTQAADALATHGLMLTIDINGGCDGSSSSSSSNCDGFGTIGNLTQLNTEDGFGAHSIAAFQALVEHDNGPLNGKWAPGLGPAGLGAPMFTQILQYAAASTNVTSIASWACHDANVGPQPQGLFDAIEVFLSAPMPPP